MVNITVRNETSETLKVGFMILGNLHPTRHHNWLEPGDTYNAGDFPSAPVPQQIEIRNVACDDFHDGDIVQNICDMGTRVAAGTGAVALGTIGVLGMAPAMFIAAGAAMQYAHRGPANNVPRMKRVGLWVSNLV